MSEGGDAVRNLLGWALMIVGGLIALLSGGCTLVFAGYSVANLFSGSAGETLSILLMVLVFGGIPLAVGTGLFAAGRALRKRRPPQVRADQFD